MRLTAVFVALILPVLAFAGPADRLVDVLRIPEMASILRDEGQDYAASLERDMLGGDAGGFYAQRIARIYDPALMTQAMNAALINLEEMDARATLAFFDTELGARILTLEASARVAMADPAVDEIAHEAYDAARVDKAPRLEQVRNFIEINNLVERNVSGALSSNQRFYQGLVDGNALSLSDEEIIAQVWEEEDALRVDTTSWLFSYLLLAYRPLSDAELDAYLVFCATPSGQALNRALFEGFDAMYHAISYEVGQAVAQAMNGRDL